MDKVKEVVHKVTHPTESKNTTTTGTHTGAHSTGTSATHTSHGTGVGANSGTAAAGPHSSNIANKADPRVDSDLDGSRNAGTAQYGPGGAHNHNHGNNSSLPGTNTGVQHSGLSGESHSTHNPAVTGTSGSVTTGPHSSNLANKLDPRVKQDQYAAGAHQTHGSSGLTGSTQTHGTSGLTGSNHGTTGLTDSSHGTTGGTGLTGGYGASTGGHGYSTNDGPHNSNALNAMDPRVDSDRDGSRNMGGTQYGAGAHNDYNTTAGGLSGSHNTHGTAGGLTGATGSHGTHSGHAGGIGSGPAPNTSGPHKSDMLNKVDPRIDSDRDGSKTVGQAPAPQY